MIFGTASWHESLLNLFSIKWSMVFADDIRKIILKLADERGPEHPFRPADVAQRMNHDNWQILMDQVSFVASVLEKEGKIKRTLSAGHVDFTKIETPLKKRV